MVNRLIIEANELLQTAVGCSYENKTPIAGLFCDNNVTNS